MSQQSVLHILKDIFQAYGYTLNSSRVSDLLASRGMSDLLYIKLDENGDFNSLLVFADSMKQVEGTGLYISNNTAPGEVVNFAAEQNLVLWDRPELEKQIGKAILAHSEGIPMELDLKRPADKPFSLFGSPPPQDNLFGMFSEPTKPEPSPFKWPGQDPVSRPKTDNIPPREEQDIRIQLPSLPINMAKTSAIKVGQAKLGEVQDFVLKFIPYYNYSYDFESKRKIRGSVLELTGQGEGVVNGITGDHTFSSLPEPLEYVEVPTENYQIKEPQITDREVSEKAVGLIIDKHTENKKSDMVKGDAIIFESKTISPAENDINISMHLVYIPIWEIQGKRNSVEINAYDGHVLEEPADDDAEFV